MDKTVAANGQFARESCSASMQLSIITTCKGRLDHLKRTLPQMLAQQAAQVIVVDYDCPQATGRWVADSHPQAHVVCVVDAPHFNLSLARNAGAAAATGDILFFVDADILLSPGTVDWIMEHWQCHRYLKAAKPPPSGLGRSDRQYNGTVAVSARSFRELDGYDAAFWNWGSEDGDLYDRLDASGLTQDSIPHQYFDSIPHDDELRTRFVILKNIKTSEQISRAYRRAKSKLAARGVALDQPARMALMNHVENHFIRSGKVPPYDLAIGNRTFRINFHRRFPVIGLMTARVRQLGH